MVDPKYSLLHDLETLLCTVLESREILEDTIQKVVVTLKKYEISEVCTDLAIYTDEDSKLLKRYCACLIIEGKSKGTIEGYRYRLNHMVNFLQIHFKDIGPYDIRYYLADLKMKGYADRTLESVRNYISAFYTWMMHEEIITKNPCVQIKPIKYNNEIKESFSELDIEKIRTNCRNVRERAMVELLLSSGIRVAELCNMNIDDLDFHSYSVHVKQGKGNKDRITYMSPVAAYYINEYLKSREDTDIALFITSRKKSRLNPGGVRYILKEIEARAEITNVHPHRFRRTFATTLSNRGMAIQVIQHLMGHDSIDTTMVYVNMNENNIRSEYFRYIQP